MYVGNIKDIRQVKDREKVERIKEFGGVGGRTREREGVMKRESG